MKIGNFAIENDKSGKKFEALAKRPLESIGMKVSIEMRELISILNHYKIITKDWDTISNKLCRKFLLKNPLGYVAVTW